MPKVPADGLGLTVVIKGKLELEIKFAKNVPYPI